MSWCQSFLAFPRDIFPCHLWTPWSAFHSRRGAERMSLLEGSPVCRRGGAGPLPLGQEGLRILLGSGCCRESRAFSEVLKLSYTVNHIVTLAADPTGGIPCLKAQGLGKCEVGHLSWFISVRCWVVLPRIREETPAPLHMLPVSWKVNSFLHWQKRPLLVRQGKEGVLMSVWVSHLSFVFLFKTDSQLCIFRNLILSCHTLLELFHCDDRQ